ncbi:two-component system response regulator [Hymenobacter nivis]|uniref:Response regulator n=1 Tax=Hymenobacter nivis TaxID=1850093 RepID=A0A502GYI4_9BACT|nr:response regulator [Hymenobacter nivis]TPG67111.1 response regulator [Hymenobacter nivis]
MQKLPSVLLVDDDPTTNFLNEHLLRTLGVTEECLVATNGAEALEVLARTCAPVGAACPALILLDVNMPVMNGIDFLEAFQPDPPASKIVIILLTTTLLGRDLGDLQQSQAVSGLISKPLTRAKINALLQQHFQRELPDAA